MGSLLFEQIDKAGLIKREKVNQDAISKLTIKDIIDFAQESVDLTNAENLSPEKQLFAHSASLSLGGSIWPCMNVECRKRKVEEIAQFASFYSDRVYIHNFLGDRLLHFDQENPPEECELQFDLLCDLEVLNTLRPLIEAEIIVPITPPYYCRDCFAKRVLKQSNDQRFESGLEKLRKRYSVETTFSLKFDENEYVLKMVGPEDLIEHGMRIRVLRDPSPSLIENTEIRKQIETGNEVRLSAKIVEDMGFAADMAHNIFNNVYFELVTSQCLNTKFVTERVIDIELINSILGNTDVSRRNQIIQKHLTTLVPFLENASASDILKIRKGEMESLLVFRKALNNAIDEYKRQGNDFTETDASAIYQDILRPGLAHLDKKVRAARKSLFKGSTTKILAWTGAITFGLYFGFLPKELAGLAEALGLTQVLAELMENLIARKDIESTIRNEELYFLWKVQRKVDNKH